MKRCVFSFIGLLATLALAILLEMHSPADTSDLRGDSETGRQMALREETPSSEEVPPVMPTQKSPKASP